jgi:hypothetical protein
MAPIKFEENIKEKLEKRTLQPSADAWTTLSNDLNNHDKKNKRGFIFYISIAASIIGILLVTTVMFNSTENQQAEPTLVDTDTNASQIKLESKTKNELLNMEVVVTISEEKKEQNQKEVIKSSIKNEPKLATISNQSINSKIENNVEKSIKNESLNVNETTQAVATINPINNKKEHSSLSTLTFEEVKAVEVVNQIKKLEIENGIVTDTEIENLLKQAEREILRERIYNETTRTVNADALLQDVEDELEQSFRTKVFDGLKSHSKTLLSAVAERNN